MPAAYVIDRTRGLVLSRAWGILTDQDLLGHARALARDPAFKPEMRQLFDFRDVVDQDLGGATLLELANLSPFGAGARRATIVRGAAGYGVARLFQLLRFHVKEEVRAFREVEPALAWLDLTADAAAVLAELAAVGTRPGGS